MGDRVLGASSTMMLPAGRSAAICCTRYPSVSDVPASRGGRTSLSGAARGRGAGPASRSCIPSFKLVTTAVLASGKDVAERMTYTHRGMQIHEPGVAGRLRIAVRHADDDGLLQSEDITEICRK